MECTFLKCFAAGKRKKFVAENVLWQKMFGGMNFGYRTDLVRKRSVGKRSVRKSSKRKHFASLMSKRIEYILEWNLDNLSV